MGRKIRLVLGVFRNVDAFDLEHDRTGAALQQAIMMRSSLVQFFMMAPPASAV